MVARSIRDSITDTHGHRLKVERNRSGEIEYNYSNGASVVTRPSGEGSADGKLKGVKEVIIAKGPHSLWVNESRNDRFRESYERIFGHK